MFDEMGILDHGFAPDGESGVRLPRRRKPLKKQIVFWLVNLLLILPAIVVVYLTVVADGLRDSMGVFATKLSKLPIPAIGVLAEFDGFNRLDIAAVTALLLCVTVSYLWYRIFLELSGCGRFSKPTRRDQMLLAVFGVMAATLILGDAALFFIGMSGSGASGWGGASRAVCIGATVVYAVGLAFVGLYHSDYHTSEER